MTPPRQLPKSPYLFSRKTCVPATLPDSMCFFNEIASCDHLDCEFLCDAADCAHIPFFFQSKCASQGSCRIPWVHFPCVFSSKMGLGFTSDCEFTCDAANCSRFPYLFSRKTRVAANLPDSLCFLKSNTSWVQCDCEFTRDAAKRSRRPYLFQGKHASQQPFQIPCVFSSKTRLGLNVIVHLHAMRSTAPTFLVFSKENTPRRRDSSG